MMGPLPSPHTSSHKVALDGATVDVSSIAPTPESAHVVSHVDPVASVALTAAAVAGVVAARRRLRPLSTSGQARVEAGGSSLSERRREFYAEPF